MIVVVINNNNNNNNNNTYEQKGVKDFKKIKGETFLIVNNMQ